MVCAPWVYCEITFTRAHSSAFLLPGVPVAGSYWYGSLAQGNEDASGTIYMRNRYYNPQTGSFTQQDPIGLAGGLNTYGFANGDPVSYSDPYGLKVVFAGDTTAARQVWNELRSRAEEAKQSRNWFIRRHGTALVGMMDRAERSDRTYVIQALQMEGVGGGLEFPDPENPAQHFIQFDPDGHAGQKSAPWIVVAHELGGALGIYGHAFPALQAENSARWIAGCLPRIGHGTNAYSNCFPR
jgi:RHS repeat-associated protein